METTTILMFILISINLILTFFLIKDLRIRQKFIKKILQSRPAKVEVVKYKTKAEAKSDKDYVDLNDIDKELVTNLRKNYRDDN